MFNCAECNGTGDTLKWQNTITLELAYPTDIYDKMNVGRQVRLWCCLYLAIFLCKLCRFKLNTNSIIPKQAVLFLHHSAPPNWTAAPSPSPWAAAPENGSIHNAKCCLDRGSSWALLCSNTSTFKRPGPNLVHETVVKEEPPFEEPPFEDFLPTRANGNQIKKLKSINLKAQTLRVSPLDSRCRSYS